MLFILIFNIENKPQPVQELRAVWITNVDSYVLFTDKAISDAMDYLASIGINVIFPVVWNKGYTLYPSNIMNYHFNVPIIQQFAGRDPLDRIIIEAHRNGIEVIPWFEFGFSSSYSLNGGHIIAKYPHWKGLNSSGQLLVKNGFDWMASTNPEVQNFMTSLVTEVIDNYDVDGIQGDDRLPAMPTEGGYDSVTVSIYKSEHAGANPPSHAQNQAWVKWRANKLNDYFKRLRDSVKTRGDYLIVSSAPSVYPWGYENYLQDSKTWVDSGIVDNFIPQIYRYDLASYTSLLNASLSYVPQSKRDIFFAGILIKSGTYFIPMDYFLGSITANRNKGIKGETFFFYEGLKGEGGIRGDTLKSKFYSSFAIPPYRKGNIFRPKALILNEEESGVTRIGKWELLPVQGFKPNIYRANDSSSASISYEFDVAFDAFYSVYAYQVPNFIFTNSARYVLYSDNDSLEVVFDQRNTKNSGWRKIGDIFLTKGKKKVLKLDNTLIESGKFILADAVMIKINRKLSPDVVVTSIDNEKGSNNNEIKSDYNLLQNYPNPFNPNTVIKYSLPVDCQVTLKLYDILGREIATLIDEEIKAGNHSYQLSTANYHLVSGIYFYRLTAGEYVNTKKIVVLK